MKWVHLRAGRQTRPKGVRKWVLDLRARRKMRPYRELARRTGRLGDPDARYYTTDQTWMLPREFEQMHPVAALPIPPDWFEEQGVPMHEGDVEPDWPLLYGNVRTAEGPLLVIGEPRDDGVGLWALKSMHPQDAVDALERALHHGIAPESVMPHAQWVRLRELELEAALNSGDDPRQAPAYTLLFDPEKQEGAETHVEFDPAMHPGDWRGPLARALASQLGPRWGRRGSRETQLVVGTHTVRRPEHRFEVSREGEATLTFRTARKAAAYVHSHYRGE